MLHQKDDILTSKCPRRFRRIAAVADASDLCSGSSTVVGASSISRSRAGPERNSPPIYIAEDSTRGGWEMRI